MTLLGFKWLLAITPNKLALGVFSKCAKLLANCNLTEKIGLLQDLGKNSEDEFLITAEKSSAYSRIDLEINSLFHKQNLFNYHEVSSMKATV